MFLIRTLNVGIRTPSNRCFGPTGVGFAAGAGASGVAVAGVVGVELVVAEPVGTELVEAAGVPIATGAGSGGGVVFTGASGLACAWRLAGSGSTGASAVRYAARS